MGLKDGGVGAVGFQVRDLQGGGVGFVGAIR